MTKKGLIIINAFNKAKSIQYQAKRLKEELFAFGVDADIKTNDFFPCKIGAEGLVTKEIPYDFIVYLDKDKYLSFMLEKAGYRLFNSAKAIEICDDKMQTHIYLADKGIKMPTTYPGILCYTDNAEIDKEKYSDILDDLGFPVVIKESYGSLGKEVYLAEDEKEFYLTLEKVRYKPHLFQRFISTSRGRDVRVIVIGGKVFASMLRQSENDFRSNVALGGRGRSYFLSEDFTELCEKTATAIGLDYCGIDVLFGADDEPILCEVNSNAFFDGIEAITGKNVAKAYAEYIVNEIF